MKHQVTNKKIKEGYFIIGIEQFSLKDLLAFEEPSMYNAGRDGWNYDVYTFDNVAICQGYRNIPALCYATSNHTDYFNGLAKKVENIVIGNKKIKIDDDEIIVSAYQQSKLLRRVLIDEFINTVLCDNGIR